MSSEGGVELIRTLHRRGLHAAAVHHARGSDIGAPTGRNGLPRSIQMEIVTVVVPAALAGEVFEFIAEKAGIDRPHGGCLYMARLGRSVPYVLPELPEEDSA